MFVWSIEINKPYATTRLIFPEMISPTLRLLKLATPLFEAFGVLVVLRVTSIRIDRGSTDITLKWIASVNDIKQCCTCKNKVIWKLTSHSQASQLGTDVQGFQQIHQTNSREVSLHQTFVKAWWNILWVLHSWHTPDNNCTGTKRKVGKLYCRR